MAHLLQDRDEFTKFCLLLDDENVKSYLEIGSFSGGSIEMVALALPKGARIVSVDMPWKVSKEQRLRQVLQRLKRDGYDTHLILGDSADQKTIAAAKTLGPYDAIFIDGDHSTAHVSSDWHDYGPMARIVGFHDIARDMPKDQHGGPHEVASFWNRLKSKHRHVEFISDKTRARTDNKASYGIGVIWNG